MSYNKIESSLYPANYWPDAEIAREDKRVAYLALVGGLYSVLNIREYDKEKVNVIGYHKDPRLDKWLNIRPNTTEIIIPLRPTLSLSELEAHYTNYNSNDIADLSPTHNESRLFEDYGESILAFLNQSNSDRIGPISKLKACQGMKLEVCEAEKPNTANVARKSLYAVLSYMPPEHPVSFHGITPDVIQRTVRGLTVESQVPIASMPKDSFYRTVRAMLGQ